MASNCKALSSSFNVAYTASDSLRTAKSCSLTSYSSANLGTCSRLAVHGHVSLQQFSQLSLLQSLLQPHCLYPWAKHPINSFILHIFVSLLVFN